MRFSSIEEMTLFEHQFWLQVLGDHSRFILNALSPKEVPLVQQTNRFINLFDNLKRVGNTLKNLMICTYEL